MGLLNQLGCCFFACFAVVLLVQFSMLRAPVRLRAPVGPSTAPTASPLGRVAPRGAVLRILLVLPPPSSLLLGAYRALFMIDVGNGATSGVPIVLRYRHLGRLQTLQWLQARSRSPNAARSFAP